MSLAGVTQPEPLDYLVYTEEDATMEQSPVMPSSQPENPLMPPFFKGGHEGKLSKTAPARFREGPYFLFDALVVLLYAHGPGRPTPNTFHRS